MSESNQKIKNINSNIKNIFIGIFNDDPEVIGNKLSRPETPFNEIEETNNYYINLKQASQEEIGLKFKKINKFF